MRLQCGAMGMLFIVLGALLLVNNLTLVLTNTGNLASNSTTITGHFHVSSLMVKLAVMTFNASTPRLIVDILSTLGNDTRVTVNGIINDGVFGTLVVVNYATLMLPVGMNRKAVDGRVPLIVLSSLMLFIYTGSVVLSERTIGIVDHSSKFILLTFFLVFVHCAFTVTHGKTSRTKRRRGVGRVPM